MKEISEKRMRNRCLSLLIVFTLVLCTPATDNGLLQGIFPELIKKAQAASGEIEDTHSLDSSVVADANLLSYLKEQIGKGDSATVKDLQTLQAIVVPASVTDLTGLGYAAKMTSLDLQQCQASSIGANEFSDCNYLESVVLPSTVKTIGKNAFENCTALTTINLDNVDSIGDQAFGGCSTLNNASLASMKDSLSELGAGAFSGCAALTEAKVPSISNSTDIHTVPAQLFNNCSSLTKVIFCDAQLKSISDQAFAGTGELTFGESGSNQLPATIESVGSSAFSDSKLTSMDLSQTKMTWISESTFMNCLIEEIVFPPAVTELRKEAFRSARLKTVIIPNTVTTLGEGVFRYAGNLTDVKLSVNVTEVPRYAFQGAGTYDFNGIDLENFHIEAYGMQVTFNGNASDSKLEKIGGSAFNASTISNGGFMADLQSLTTIEEFAFSYTDFVNLTIPACVQTLGKQALDGMYELKTVTFAAGSKVTELPEQLFGSPNSPTNKKTYADLVLETVQLPEKLETIGKDCFGNCFALNTVGYSGKMIDGEVHFPETLTTIGEQAFEKCGLYENKLYDENGDGYTTDYCGMSLYNTGIRKVVIPDSVTSIGKGAFQNCVLLEELYLGDGITELPEDMCKGCGSYPYAAGKNTKLQEKDRLVTPDPSTGGETVYEPLDFLGLKKVKLPAKLETLGNSAFSECYALEDFCDADGTKLKGELPGTLTTIGKSAFASCKKLKTIVFPSALTELGESAFEAAGEDISDKIQSASTGKDVTYYHQYGGLSTIDFRYAVNLKTIGSKAFYRTNITSINFPSSAQTLPASVCENCYNLKTVTIPENVTEIGKDAFKNTYNLESVSVPLSAVWADSIFSGVAARAKGQLTINAAPVTKSTNVYIGKENVLDFNCIKNFSELSVTVTDQDKDPDDETNDLLKHDSNEYVSVRGEYNADGNIQQIIMTGKQAGETTVRVSGSIHLEGDINEENNTTALNDSALILQITQLYKINVTQNPISVLELSAAQLVEEASKPVLYLSYGSTTATKLSASYTAENSDEETTDTVTWSVEDSSVVTIDGTPAPSVTQSPEKQVVGVSTVNLLPGALGDTVVSAQSSSGVKQADCTVRVRLPLTNLVLSEKDKILDANKEFTLTVDETRYSADHAALLEQNPAYGDVYRFTSSNESVATVDSVTGKVTTVAEGEAVITATSLVSGRTATCKVTVQGGYLPPAVSVALSEDALEMYVGDAAVALTAVITPAEASQQVEWTSSNTDVATVSSGIVEAHKAGSAKITAKTENGKSATCEVTVKQHVDSLTLSASELTVTVGKTETLTAEVLPADDTDQKIIWSSSDESVATVSSSGSGNSGSVKGIKAGEATITAQADGKSATCKVSVKAVPESVTLSETEASLEVGKQKTLTATVLPAEADQTVQWTSSNDQIATVADGVVTAVKEGSCSITATAAGNSKKAICKLTVTAAGTGSGGEQTPGTVDGQKLAKVKLSSAKNVKKKSIKIKWKKVTGAVGYQVACGKKRKVTKKTSLTIKKLKKKKKYAVKVRAYMLVDGKKVYGAWSKTKKVKVKK